MKLDYVARPAGTKPAAVYWRRRAVLLGVVLLLVWFAAKACGGSGSSASRAAGATQSATAHPSAQTSTHPAAGGHSTAPSAAQVGTPGSTASGNSTGAAGATAPAAVTAMCDGSTLSLRAAVNRLNLHRPFTAGITLQIATRSASPCGLDAGALRAQVLDGSQVLWSSDGCPDAGAAGSTGGTAVADGGSSATGNAAGSGANSPASGNTGTQSLITVPSQSAADQHYTWHGNVCSGQLAPGHYDVVGRLGLAQAFAGTVTVS